MKLFAPRYYKEFKCIADQCRHNCCIGWEIDIDDDTLEKYCALSGAQGDRIRGGIETGADGAHFALSADGKCPQLDSRGLCRIISTLGEGYLCDICREHPRFYNTVGGRMECGVGAVCEEAARLILSAEDYSTLVPIGERPDVSAADTVGDFDATLWRAKLFEILSDTTQPYMKRLHTVAADYGVSVALSEEAYRNLFADLEYLDEGHRALFCAYHGGFSPNAEIAPLYERFLAYLVYRHATAEATARGFRLAVGFCMVLCGLFGYLIQQGGLSPVEAAMAVSEELEYSEDNTEAIRFALELHNL